MRTNDLISELSAGSPKPRGCKPTTTILLTVAVACLVVALATSGWLGLRADLGHSLSTDRTFVLNVAFIVSVAAIAMTIVRDLSVPGRGATLSIVAVLLPFLVLGSLAIHEAHTASFHQLWPHHAQASMLSCLWQTSILAVPAFAILMIGVRYLAPTNLRRVGFYIGLLAGAIGAFGFCLHDRHESLAFGAAVYAAAIIVCAFIGALVGPRLLRWY